MFEGRRDCVQGWNELSVLKFQGFRVCRGVTVLGCRAKDFTCLRYKGYFGSPRTCGFGGFMVLPLKV